MLTASEWSRYCRRCFMATHHILITHSLNLHFSENTHLFWCIFCTNVLWCVSRFSHCGWELAAPRGASGLLKGVICFIHCQSFLSVFVKQVQRKRATELPSLSSLLHLSSILPCQAASHFRKRGSCKGLLLLYCCEVTLSSLLLHSYLILVMGLWGSWMHLVRHQRKVHSITYTTYTPSELMPNDRCLMTVSSCERYPYSPPMGRKVASAEMERNWLSNPTPFPLQHSNS